MSDDEPIYVDATARSGARIPKPIENTHVAGKDQCMLPSRSMKVIPPMSAGILCAAAVMALPRTRNMRLARRIIKLILAMGMAQRICRKSVMEGSKTKTARLIPGVMESSLSTCFC